MKTFNKSYVADHKYAQSNGYTGSFDDFVNLQYELYVTSNEVFVEFLSDVFDLCGSHFEVPLMFGV